MSSAVYVQTNDATDNEVIAFTRADDGTLAPLGRYSTGGRGSGKPHLASAGSVVLSDDGRWLADRAGSDGSKPTSVAISGALAYVLNNGTPNISGFHLAEGKLTALA